VKLRLYIGVSLSLRSFSIDAKGIVNPYIDIYSRAPYLVNI
jgi:hypothetical protein